MANDRDKLGCSSSTGASTATGSPWIDHDVMPNTSTQGNVEDHPSFDFYGSQQRRIVSGTHRSGGTGVAVRQHFPDGPSVAPIEYDVVADKVDYTDVVSANGKLHMVWSDGSLGSGTVRYQTCDFNSTVDCTDPDDWLQPNDEIIADVSTGFHVSPQGTVIAVDGDRQFVAWQYISQSQVGGDPQWRVAVARRCEGGAWTIENVRTPSVADKDQVLVVGKPSLESGPEQPI